MMPFFVERLLAAQPRCPDLTVDRLSIVWSGSNSGCSSSAPSPTCTQSDLITFDAAASGYDFGCGPHEFTWDFADETPPVHVRQASHFFPPYTGAQSYRVRLTIQNGSSTMVLGRTIGFYSTPNTTTTPRIAAFVADAYRTMHGQTVTLAWEVDNSYLIEIEPIGYQVSGISTGSHSFEPEATATYRLTAYSTSATASKSLVVNVVDSQCVEAPPAVSIEWLGQTTGCTRKNLQTCAVGEALLFSVRPFDDVPDCYHDFRWRFGESSTSRRQKPILTIPKNGDFAVELDVTNASGIVKDTASVHAGTPTLNAVAYLIATPQRVQRGQPVTLQWSARNTAELLINPLNLRTNELHGTCVVTPDASTTYTMTAAGEGPVATPAATARVVVDAPRRRAVRH